MVSNRVFEIIQSHDNFFFTNIENKRAIWAGKTRVTLKPSQRFFNLLAAVTTSNGEINFIWIKHCRLLSVFVTALYQ